MKDKLIEVFNNYFDTIFKELIQFGKDVTLEVEETFFEYSETPTVSYKTLSVNNIDNYYTYSQHIENLYKKGLDKVLKRVNELNKEDSLLFLETISYNFEELENLTIKKNVIYPENEFGTEERYEFSAFINPKVTGVKNSNYHLKSIEKTASFYAELWEDELKKAYKKLEYITNKTEFSDNNSNEQYIYIDSNRLDELKRISNTEFDLSRLIRFCEEINIASDNKLYFSISFLVRALIDHIPPIFNKNTFNEVAGSYGEFSFKKSMSNLNKSSRSIADGNIHSPIKRKVTLPNRVQIDFSSDLDVLLAVIIIKLKE